MAAGDITIGRRVRTIDELELPGDYFYNPGAEPDGAGHISLWFILPTAKSADHWAEPRSPHNGRHRIASPIWTIMEHEDGSVSAQPSIGLGAQPYYWHGYLDEGHRWREV